MSEPIMESEDELTILRNRVQSLELQRNALRRELDAAQTKCAEMREALEKIYLIASGKGKISNNYTDDLRFIERVSAKAVSPCGKGWVRKSEVIGFLRAAMRSLDEASIDYRAAESWLKELEAESNG